MAISSISIRRPVSVIMLIITLVALGALGLKNMPVELMPTLNVPVVTIQTRWTGATPNEVDKLITKKLEDAMENVDGINDMSSTSYEGFSVIILEFDYGVDIDEYCKFHSISINDLIGLLISRFSYNVPES